MADHPLARRIPVPEILVTPTGFGAPVSESLPQAIQRIVEALQPEKIILFGSYAGGAPTPDSDVDLLIIAQTDASEMDRFLDASLILYPRPFPVDILVKTPEEIRNALEAGDYFIQEILARGLVLYER